MDIFDRASEYEEKMRLSAIRDALLPESHVRYSHCIDCGEPIPEERQRAVKGCLRCIDCQEAFERWGQ